MPRPIARCSTPMAASKATPPRWRGCGTSGARARRRSHITAPRSSALSREADWLRHAVEELGRLAPETGEETALAERRTAMMQAEKVAEDLRSTHDSVSGPQSPVPPLSAALRRLERRAVQAPALIEPVVKAIDAALTALDEARTHLEQALRAADSIRRSSSASRSACSRCAPPGANTMCRSMIWPRWAALPGRSGADRRRRRAARRAGEEAQAAEARSAKRRRRCRPAAAAPRKSSTRRSMAN